MTLATAAATITATFVSGTAGTDADPLQRFLQQSLQHLGQRTPHRQPTAATIATVAATVVAIAAAIPATTATAYISHIVYNTNFRIDYQY
jgi:hypothetical protein